MSKEDKQRILATNRLLEILRAERSSEDVVSSEEASVDSDFLIEEEVEDLQYVSKSKSDQVRETPVSEIDEFPSLFIDEDDNKIDEGHDIKYEASVEDQDQLFEDEQEQPVGAGDIFHETDVDPEVAKLAASLTSSESESASSSNYSEEIKNDLLLKTELPKDFEVSGSKDIILPPEFNDSLITFHEEIIEKPNWEKRVLFLKRYFSDNKRKITIYIDNNTIYLLQTLATLMETEVEKVKSFSLPYEYGNQMITGINDLLIHILENEIDHKDKKLSFGAYFSMTTPSKTIVIKSPKLKKKELTELVEWNANKNLPFSTENKSVNWKIAKSESESETQDVIIGVIEKDSVNAIDTIFNRNDINLRYTSTLSILLWKSFVKNYPDKDVGSHVIIHLGESKTLVIVVTDHILQFSREIALGAQDFYNAIVKKVETNESGQTINIALAKDVLMKYGYPQNQTGLTAGSNIDLNKITIAIRPVVERINSELNRTLNYFKNQKSTLEWKELLFDGVAAAFPGLLETVQENIYQKVELLNPMRTGEYYINDDVNIPPQQYPNYVLNFALAADEVEDFNIAPTHIRDNYKYSFHSKVIAGVLALVIPLFLFTGLYSSSSLKRGQRKIEAKKTELQRLSVDTQDYASFEGDLKIINLSNHFINNDRTYSQNQIKMLQLFSSIVPEEIKLTELNFVNATGLADSVITAENFKEHLEVAGFVNKDKSVANIYLTDFILQLEKMQYFADVKTLEKSENAISNKGELFFRLRLDLRL
ncbi:pilus assembly protein PilM [bacterium]|nr:pilus assembly protein PilM [bacterium]